MIIDIITIALGILVAAFIWEVYERIESKIKKRSREVDKKAEEKARKTDQEKD